MRCCLLQVALPVEQHACQPCRAAGKGVAGEESAGAGGEPAGPEVDLAEGGVVRGAGEAEVGGGAGAFRAAEGGRGWVVKVRCWFLKAVLWLG